MSVGAFENTIAPDQPDMTEDPFPIDFVPKIQPSCAVDQTLFRYNTECAEWVACKFRRSSWFVNHPREAFLSPHQKLLVMTYEDDDHLVHRTPEEEVERYRELEGTANGAIPGDRFTYNYDQMSRREVVKEIEDSVHRQLVIYDRLQDEGIDMPLFPAIVGWEDWHIERCRPLKEINTDVAFDTTQINSRYDKKNQLETVDEILQPDRIFANGTVAPDHLRLMPESVVAFSGKYSILEEIWEGDESSQRDQLAESIEKRIPAIYEWQSKLTEY